MAKVDLFEFGDLLSHGTSKLGYEWNDLHEIMVRDEVPPMYERRKNQIHIDELHDYNYSEDSIKVLTSFMNEHGISEMVIV